MSVFKRNPRLLFSMGALSLAAALTACGGSDDPVTEPVSVTPAVAKVDLPEGGTSTGLTVTGNLNYGVFSPGAAIPRVESADVANEGLDGTLTLNASIVDAASDRVAPAAVANDSFVVVTADGWSNVQWPDGSDGVLALNGNAALFCNTSTDSGQVGISGHLQQVLDLADLRGKSFQFKACSNGAVENDGGIVFNADGSAQFEDADGVINFDAVTVADYFSEAGWRIDGGLFKARAIYRTASDGTKQYVIVDISNDVLTDGSPDNTVALMVEVQAPR